MSIENAASCSPNQDLKKSPFSGSSLIGPIEHAEGRQSLHMSCKIQSRAHHFLDTLDPTTRQDVEGKIDTLRYHESIGCLSPEMYVGKHVFDWEAGLCGFAAAFYCLGACKVTAIASWVAESAVPPGIRAGLGIIFEQISIEDFVKQRAVFDDKFDLVFLNTVTEHISDLSSSFDAIRGLLKDDRAYVNVHDNYYSPCGSHDHGFWFYGDNGRVDFQGVDCWARVEKCQASAEHRAKLLTTLPWTWNDRLEARRNSSDCTICPYYKRSQPWAHLTAVDSFPVTFDDESFFTLRAGSSLNKFTTFQVRPLLVEAGLRVENFHQNRATNTVPRELVEKGFSDLELTTTTTVWLCRKEPI